ncbi:hypothetical protein CHS0354_032166 [Potamilus streckersoni]|uniref:Uncharacterized protein n=1 Tax=Potamilus streckersoni TaxID=2493646 RepID=A0AAE0WDD4_9BIVA|nr:hypothetical protein CHS0354_032166 [Potamilus streckersoni]
MDGLDEVDNSSSFIEKIMQRRLYPYVTVLATTRPWKIGQLSLIRSAHFDLLLDLQGFSFDNSMLFAKRIFEKYYKDKFAIAQFQRDISKTSMIKRIVHIPLLLLFIVHVWYEKKSFKRTIHELYLEILNVMVNRYMEGKERKEPNKEKQDKEKTYSLPLESKTFIVIPKLRNLSIVHHFGEGLLLALCEVANHFLISDAKETSLAFEEKALVELLGKDGLSKLQTALDLGILSKSDSPGIFRKRICLTFLHKTVLEFLASINICCREDRYNIFLNSLTTLYDVFQNENIIKFLAGISHEHCLKILEKIYELCDKDKTMIQNEHRMLVLSRLYINCLLEAYGEPVNQKLYCMHVDNVEWNVLQPVFSSTSNVRTNLKWLTLSSYFLDDAELDLSESNCLEYLSLKEVAINGKLLLSKCTQLKCLKLYKCSIDDATLDLSVSNCLQNLEMVYCSLDVVTLHLPESNCLENICLVHVTMKGIQLPSKYTELRYLKLRKYTIDNSTLDLSKSNWLEYLSIKTMTMMGGLLLSKNNRLKCLKMNDCIIHHATLDLSESRYLEYLSLKNVTMKGKLLLSKCTQLKHLTLHDCTLDDATLDLSDSNFLECLSLQYVTMNGKLLLSKCTQLEYPKQHMYFFVDAGVNLSDSNCLKCLSLVDVTMKGKLLLSKCPQLKSMKLQQCHLDDVTLDLSVSHCLEHLIFECLTINGKLLPPNYIQLKCLKLWKCRLDDTTLDLSESSCLEHLSLVDVIIKGKILLLKCTQLSSVELVDCTFHDGILDLLESNRLERFLCNKITFTSRNRLSNCTLPKQLMLVQCSLGELTQDLSVSTSPVNQILHDDSQCKQLQSVTMKNAYLGDATLSFDNVDDFYALSLDNVSRSKECMLLLCNSLGQCKQLHSISVKNVNLFDVLFSLDNLDYLKSLSLDNVTMSKECKEAFCNSLSQCKQLHRLSIKNMDLGDALLSLDSFNQLNILSLDKITMSKECKEVFCSSLSQYKLIRRLSMMNWHLGDAVLSLDSENHLHELNLDNVTMSKKCKEVFCKSLSQCKQVHRLSIKNMNLCDTLFSHDGFKFLDKLNLDNLEVEKINKLICKCLSRCKKLSTVSLKNLDMSDGLHNLDEAERLEYLTIDSVTMCKNGYRMLCNSLSRCTQLKQLELMNLALGDAQFNLNKTKKKLHHLTIDKVTMSENGYVMLFKSMSGCTELKHLELKNLDLTDAQLNLDKTGMLYSLTIDNVTMCQDGYVILFNSMPTCKQLKHLKLLNLDLGDANPALTN